MFSSVRLQIYLFIYLILVKHFYRLRLTLNTFEDVILPLAVEMYMMTCLLHALHAFQDTMYDTHAKTGQNQLKLAGWNQ